MVIRHKTEKIGYYHEKASVTSLQGLSSSLQLKGLKSESSSLGLRYEIGTTLREELFILLAFSSVTNRKEASRNENKH